MLSEVFNVDCMEYMRTLPDKAFDLAVVDPPYFSGPEKRGYYGQRVSKVGVSRDYPISPTWNIPNTKPGNKILDTHLGSGSSRIACYEMGLDFIGCEINTEYFEAQEKRFEEYKKEKERQLELAFLC